MGEISSFQTIFPRTLSEKSSSSLSHSGENLIDTALRTFMKFFLSQVVEYLVNIAAGFTVKWLLRTVLPPPSIKRSIRINRSLNHISVTLQNE